MKKLTIDRRFWARGLPTTWANILLGHNGLCCLGFFALECGLTPIQLLNLRTPSEIQKTEGFIPEEMLWLVDEHLRLDNTVGKHLMELNDVGEKDSPTREAAIAKHFADHGWEVEFIN